MDYRALFYWLSVADNVKTLFWVFNVIFITICLISTIAYFVASHTERANAQTEEDEANQKMARKWMWWCYPIMIFFSLAIALTPSRKDALLIVAGGTAMNFLSTDSTAKALPKDLMNFVSTELNQMAAEAKVQIKTAKTKEQVLDDVKDMSTTELLELIKKDTSLRSIILN